MPGRTPTGKRSWSNDEKRQFVRAWLDAAGVRGARAALLRQWRLDDRSARAWEQAYRDGRLGPGAKPGRLSMGNEERARLLAAERENEQLRRRLAAAEASLVIMGKAHELLEQTLNSAAPEDPGPQIPPSLMSVSEYQKWLTRYNVT